MGIIAGVVVAALVIGALWLFTPFGFFNVQCTGPFQMDLTVNGRTMTATMEDNTSAHALRQMLERGPKTVSMRDYAGMEKVGMLWKGLPANDTDLTTRPGDLVLFMGSSFVIYYRPNHYSFTLLGHIDGVTQAELVELLDDGNVDVTLSLP